MNWTLLSRRQKTACQRELRHQVERAKGEQLIPKVAADAQGDFPHRTGRDVHSSDSLLAAMNSRRSEQKRHVRRAAARCTGVPHCVTETAATSRKRRVQASAEGHLAAHPDPVPYIQPLATHRQTGYACGDTFPRAACYRSQLAVQKTKLYRIMVYVESGAMSWSYVRGVSAVSVCRVRWRGRRWG